MFERVVRFVVALKVAKDSLVFAQLKVAAEKQVDGEQPQLDVLLLWQLFHQPFTGDELCYLELDGACRVLEMWSRCNVIPGKVLHERGLELILNFCFLIDKTFSLQKNLAQ